MKKESFSDRRKFILTMARGVGLSAMGALVWSAYVGEVKAAPLILRPPGALSEDDFLKTCIKCGLCVEACPYDTLTLSKPGDNNPIGTPFYTPRDIPCYMCDDIPCVPVCPSGALDMPSLLNEKKELDINKSQMGLAVVHKESCIAFWGLQCDACYRACPLLDEAITLEYMKNERTGKHAFLLPIVHSDVCTGCGLCEQACVTEKPAIFVLPREHSTGKAGSHYVKGWDKKDQKRVGDRKVEEIETKTKRSEKAPVDYLNKEIEY